MSDPQAQRRRVTAVFDLVAGGYDSPALRYFPFCADRLVERLAPQPGQKILDVATGTGAAALAAAQHVGPQGRVIAIDLAENMLAQAHAKIAKFGLANIDLHVMDAAAPEFRSGYFDHVVCAFGLFFLPDMHAALAAWRRVLKPGGRVMFSCFGKRAFQPMAELFVRRAEAYGVTRPLAAARLNEPEACRALLAAAGFEAIEVHTEQRGYHLAGVADWWEIVWNSGLRGLLEDIPADRREAFQAEHLAELAPLLSANGLWLDVETLFAGGRKPAEKS